MRTKVNFYVIGTVLMCGSYLFSACSKTNLSEEVGSGTEKQKFISLTLTTPVSDKVIIKGSRADSNPIHEEQEWTIKTLNLYMFKKGTGTGDTDYTLFKTQEGITTQAGEAQQGSNTVSDTGNGKYHFTTAITDDMIGGTFKFVLVANDKPANATVNTTTLATFKQSLATAKLTENNESADKLVGGAGEEATGFPMTDIAVNANGESEEDITIGYSDVSIKASMLRNVARIDFFNYTPNLKITGAKLLNAASHSYLFGTGQGTANEFNPYKGGDLKTYSLNPTAEWSGKFKAGVEYVGPAVGTEDTETESRQRNTLKHVFYLYEQENTDQSPVQVQIDYTLTNLAGSPDLNKTIVVDLKSVPSTYINPTRNYLYTIKLGDGTKVDNEIKVSTVIVDDWISGGNIDEEINPDEDTSVNGN